MSQPITSPPILDSTGLSIASKLQSISDIISMEVTPATTATLGIVKPDGTSISVDSTGKISANIPAVATTATVGTVKPDGTTVTITSNGTISAQGGDTTRGMTDAEIDTIWNNVFGS